MKIVFFGWRNKNRRRIKGNTRVKSAMLFERFLFVAFVLAFSTMIFIQAAMMNESARTFLIQNNNYEGVPLSQEVSTFSEGEVGLQLINATNNPALKVLVNGEPVVGFDANVTLIRVRNNDVIQIDGSKSRTPAKVKILTASENIKDDLEGKQVDINGNIREICRIQLK